MAVTVAVVCVATLFVLKVNGVATEETGTVTVAGSPMSSGRSVDRLTTCEVVIPADSWNDAIKLRPPVTVVGRSENSASAGIGRFTVKVVDAVETNVALMMTF